MPGHYNPAINGGVSVITSLLGLCPGGGGVCPKPRLKGRRGRFIAACKTPVTSRNAGGRFYIQGNGTHTMFKKIVQGWQEARGAVLRQEVEDTILRLNQLGPEVNAHACQSLFLSRGFVEERYGPISNISDHGKKQIAKMLLKKARENFDFDMGKGHGLFMLSAYLESSALPGHDAAFVKAACEEFINAAAQVAENAKEASRE